MQTEVQQTIRTPHPQPSAEPRPDLYSAVHKGLRAALGHVLTAVGATDPDDERAWSTTTAELEAVLALLSRHLREEDEFLEDAIDRRAPRGGTSTRDEHVEHEAAIASIRAAVARVSASPPSRRRELASSLYRDLAVFVGESLLHMEREERENMALLHGAYTDAELLAILGALLAQIPPDAMAGFHRWMIPSLHHGERLAMLQGMKAGAPPEAFAGVMAIAERTLSRDAYGALSAALR
jgi:hypothetical protein